jgi:anti-sigma B factor antagonist
MLTIHQQQTPDDQTIIRPVGELDAFSVTQFRQILADLDGSGSVVIDLSRVAFIDSAGLGALIGGIRHARERGGHVAVACARPTLTRLLHSTGFDRIVAVVPTVTDAAGALQGAGRGGAAPILVDRVDDDPSR